MYAIAARTLFGTIGSRFLAGGIRKSSSLGGHGQLHLEPSLQKLITKTVEHGGSLIRDHSRRWPAPQLFQDRTGIL
jgi:hypothetical protein